jgi:hypothetical protein
MEITAKEILEKSEFCKLHSGFHGEEISNLKQLVSQTFTGEELYDFVKHCLEIKGKEIAIAFAEYMEFQAWQIDYQHQTTYTTEEHYNHLITNVFPQSEKLKET